MRKTLRKIKWFIIGILLVVAAVGCFYLETTDYDGPRTVWPILGVLSLGAFAQISED